MRTLEKQQKKGYYTVTIGYETVIEQSIWKNLAYYNNIPVYQPKGIQDDFAPGSTFFSNIGSYAASRSIKNAIDMWAESSAQQGIIGSPFMVKIKNAFKGFNLNFDKKTGFGEKNEFLETLVTSEPLTLTKHFKHIKNFASDTWTSTVYPLNNAIFWLFNIIPGEIRIDVIHFIISWAFLAYTSTGKQGLCNNVVIPETLSKIFNKTLLRRLDNNISSTNKLWGSLNNLWTWVQDATFSFLGYFTKFQTAGEQIKKQVENGFYALVNQYYMNMPFLTQTVLYGGGSLGIFLTYRFVCRSIINNVMTFDVETKGFNNFLKMVLELVDPRIQIMETYQMDGNVPKAFMKLKIPNKAYVNTNSVDSQIHLFFKNILKHLPQNVFVDKIEFFGEEENDLVMNVSKFEKNVEKSIMNDLMNAMEKKEKKKKALMNPNLGNTVFDLVQVIYDVNGKTKYRDSEIVTQDREMIRYARQHYSLYKFYNRQTLGRKYMFDFVTNTLLKPRELSPSIPKHYIFKFRNKSKENMKLYFYKDDVGLWFKHKTTYKNDRKSKVDSFYNDIYEVQLDVTKFVDKNLENILNDIPTGLQVKEIRRPAEGRTDCKDFILYPFVLEADDSKCKLPKNMTTVFDTRIINAIREIKKKRSEQ